MRNTTNPRPVAPIRVMTLSERFTPQPSQTTGYTLEEVIPDSTLLAAMAIRKPGRTPAIGTCDSLRASRAIRGEKSPLEADTDDWV